MKLLLVVGSVCLVIAPAALATTTKAKPKPADWATEAKAETFVKKTRTATFRWTLEIRQAGGSTQKPMTETWKPSDREHPFVECVGAGASHPTGLPLYRRFVCQAFMRQPLIIRGLEYTWTCLTANEVWFVTTTTVPGKLVASRYAHQVRLTEAQKIKLDHSTTDAEECWN